MQTVILEPIYVFVYEFRRSLRSRALRNVCTSPCSGRIFSTAPKHTSIAIFAVVVLPLVFSQGDGAPNSLSGGAPTAYRSWPAQGENPVSCGIMVFVYRCGANVCAWEVCIIDFVRWQTNTGLVLPHGVRKPCTRRYCVEFGLRPGRLLRWGVIWKYI